MTDVKEAADRLRRVKAGEDPKVVYAEFITQHARDLHPLHLKEFLWERQQDDHEDLADAYLAQQPDDSLKCPKCDQGYAGRDCTDEAMECRYCDDKGIITAEAFCGLKERFDAAVGDWMAHESQANSMADDLFDMFASDGWSGDAAAVDRDDFRKAIAIVRLSQQPSPSKVLKPLEWQWSGEYSKCFAKRELDSILNRYPDLMKPRTWTVKPITEQTPERQAKHIADKAIEDCANLGYGLVADGTVYGNSIMFDSLGVIPSKLAQLPTDEEMDAIPGSDRQLWG